MSVVITDIPGADYTWADFGGGDTWNGLNSKKTWKGAHIAAHAADVTETLNLAEALARSGPNITLMFGETIGFVDIAGRGFKLSFDETIGVIERQFRNAAAVISDIVLDVGDSDLAAFQVRLSKAGPTTYGDFVSYIDGQQDIDKSIVRYTLKTLTDSLPRIDALRAIVDMEDVRDRGRVTTVASKSSVSFARTFVIPPEVTTVQVGGTVIAQAIISNITPTGFDIEHRNVSNALVGGTSSWQAHGY